MNAAARMGVLEADEVWQGDVRVEGDLLIPAGRRLVLSPGCRLSFVRPPRWSCAVFRSAVEDYPIEASQRELCDIVVLGRLEALGTETQPIELGSGAESWGGLLCLGSGRADLAHVRLAACGDAALQTLDDARVRLDQCALTGTEVGIRSLGLSRVTVSGGSVRAGRSGIQAGEGAQIHLNGAEIVDTPEGCSLWGCAQLDAKASRFVRLRDRGLSARESSWARLRDCAWLETPSRAEQEPTARLDLPAEQAR